jgi:formylmethanofuran dehydrogenase subunit E
MVKIIDDSLNTCSKCGVFKHDISLVHYGETDLCYPCYFFKKYAREAMDEVLKEMAEKRKKNEKKLMGRDTRMSRDRLMKIPRLMTKEMVAWDKMEKVFEDAIGKKNMVIKCEKCSYELNIDNFIGFKNMILCQKCYEEMWK